MPSIFKPPPASQRHRKDERTRYCEKNRGQKKDSNPLEFTAKTSTRPLQRWNCLERVQFFCHFIQGCILRKNLAERGRFRTNPGNREAQSPLHPPHNLLASYNSVILPLLSHTIVVPTCRRKEKDRFHHGISGPALLEEGP